MKILMWIIFEELIKLVSAFHFPLLSSLHKQTKWDFVEQVLHLCNLNEKHFDRLITIDECLIYLFDLDDSNE